MNAIKGTITYTRAQSLCGSARLMTMAPNTVLSQEGENYVITLYATPIITLHPDGAVTLSHGGYRTQTTKRAINNYTPEGRVESEKGVWIIKHNGTKHVFTGAVRLEMSEEVTV